jgi:NAD+ synthase (glutamine-hydrolysing)
MKIALAQINPIIGNFKYNLDKIVHYANQARSLSADLVVFPELALCGYPPRDLLERPAFIDANDKFLKQLMAAVSGIGVVCGYVSRQPDKAGKPLFNTAALFENGALLHQTHKQLLPTYDIFDERRFFEPGPQGTVFEYKGRRLGLTICEDVWNDKDIFRPQIYPVDPVKRLIEDGTDLIINISASPFHTGKQQLRMDLLSAIAKKYRIPVVFNNQVGGNDSIVFDGFSSVFDQRGQIVVRANDFEEDLVCYDSENAPDASPTMHPVIDSEEAAVLKALVTGTRDYVTKCGFKKVLVGLSGGIDSALTVAVAVQALGPKNVAAIFMPSPYTSADNFEDTKLLAENLRISLTTIPIEKMYADFVEYIVPDGDSDDPGITEQNIQARIRGTILMGLSNRTGALVLSTGNKSELAVGYCTLYGDMNGGLAVISDVPKIMVYNISRLINKDVEIIPDRIITKAPSAELKPDQTDQDDLPPYEIIDPILKGYIEEYKDVDELVAAGFDRKVVTEIISRVEKNEYKRHQAAPGLKVTPKAFGEGRRYPIARGW